MEVGKRPSRRLLLLNNSEIWYHNLKLIFRLETLERPKQSMAIAVAYVLVFFRYLSLAHLLPEVEPGLLYFLYKGGGP